MLSSDFLAEIAHGKKIFDGVELHYADLNGNRFEDVKILQSKFNFVLLRHCMLHNVIFEKCHFVFCGFGYSTFSGVKFKNCTIEYSGATDAIFENTLMEGCTLSWVGLDGANFSGLEMRNCREFKVIRNLSEITQDDLENSIASAGSILNALDFDVRKRVLDSIKVTAARYGTDANKIKPQPHAPAPYGTGKTATVKGYQAFNQLIDEIVALYGSSSPYKNKKNAYDRENRYT